MELDDRTYRDLGISGYDRSNVERGALAIFLSAVKTGKVRRGDYLLIEAMDRLTRDQVFHAQRLLSDLVQAGIVVVTLVDGRVWTIETLNDPMMIMYSVMLMSRSHEESERKSVLLKERRAEERRLARETGRILTKQCPRWLRPVDGRFEIIDDIADSVRRVFELRIAGMGYGAIASRANEEKWPAPSLSGTWHKSQVVLLINGRAVRGEHQPYTKELEQNPEQRSRRVRRPEGDPIIGYYPELVSEDTWQRAQAVLLRKRPFPGRRDTLCRNILQGLARCSCGGTLTRKNYGSGAVKYLCTHRARGLTKCPLALADSVEDAVLQAAIYIRPGLMADKSQAEALATRHDLATSRHAEISSRLDRLVGSIADDADAPRTIVAAVRAAEKELEVAEKELAIVAALAADQAVGETWLNTLRGAYDVLDSGNSERLSAVRESLARIIETLVINTTEKTAQIVFYGFPRPVRVTLSEVPNLMRHKPTAHHETVSEGNWLTLDTQGLAVDDFYSKACQ